MNEQPSRRDSLWWLVVSPVIWVVHLLACYVTAAVWCAKVAGADGTLDPVRVAIGVYTLVALGGVLVVAWHSYRRHRFGTATVPHDFDTRADRHRFLGFAALLLSVTSAVAIVFVALPALFIGSCR